jgi:hypothetical protein
MKHGGKRPKLTKEERAKRDARRARRERTAVADQRRENQLILARSLKGLGDLQVDPRVGF